MKKTRNYQIDNIKAIMIFLVVLGHLLEFHITDKTNYILLIIYSFHMPVFVYFSGYLAKYNPEKMIKNILLPYISVQLFAYLFYNLFSPTNFYLVSAYHSLWYMLSLFIWYLLVPILDRFHYPKLMLLISVFLGLLIGYDITAGTVGSISRTFTFFPFFLLGYYSNKNNWVKNTNNKFCKYINFILVLIICFLLFIYRNKINVQWMYGYAHYDSLNYNSIIRFILYLIGLIWIFFFRSFTPKKKMFFSKVGRNSITIYLFHYFVVYFLVEYKLLLNGNHPTINCILYATLITVLLSSDKLVKIFKKK